MLYLLIALGGAFGSVARYWLSEVTDARFGTAFPWGTLAANITGCIVIGFFAVLGSQNGRFLGSPEARSFLLVGVCGGYTTFSAFSLQTVELLRAGDWFRASAYIVGSVVVCLIGVGLGQLLAAPFGQTP